MKLTNGPRWRAFCVLLIPSLMALLCSGSAQGAGSAQQSVTITVTVLAPPPCTFNNGNDVNVSFGNDVLTTQVNGVNYQQQVPYNLVCTGLANNTLKLQFQGAGAGFDNTALGTNKADLGIRFMNVGGTSLPLNTWLNFTYTTGIPAIMAVPVKRSGSTLTSGSFTATATFMVDYQ